LNDRTRAFTQRVLPKTLNNDPNQEHAAVYAATLHYLKAAAALGLPRARHSGLEVVEMMKRMPTDDDCFGRGVIRADGHCPLARG
jgi:branched-chain amino acid transport system substrate-binding protein